MARDELEGLGDVRGFVADGFESVAEEFATATAEAGEDGAAVAATVEGEMVVDLWRGDAGPGRAWERDTLVCVYSCTKGLTALCAHLLADRGLLDVDAPVGQYWPEYATNGKEATLVRHFLNHQAGVVTFPRYWDVVGPDGVGLTDLDLMAAHLAAAAPSWEPGTAVGYHALTYGSLVGELVRRIDGRSIGAFFADEVAEPLGLDIFIGLPDGRAAQACDTYLPDTPPDEAVAVALAAAAEMWKKADDELALGQMESPEAMLRAALFVPPGEDPNDWLLRVLNNPVIRRGEIPGGGAMGTARALAGMYAPLSNGGGQLVSPASIEQWSTEHRLPDGSPGLFGLGYAVYGATFGGSDGTFGHPGAFGNLGVADPVHHVSYGYVKNRMVADGDVGFRPLRALYRVLGT